MLCVTLFRRVSHVAVGGFVLACIEGALTCSPGEEGRVTGSVDVGKGVSLLELRGESTAGSVL